MNQQLIRKYYYGDIPEDKSGGNIVSKETKTDWPLWEVFIRTINMQAACMLLMHRWR